MNASLRCDCGGCSKALANIFMDGNGAGQKVCRAMLLQSRAKKFFSVAFEYFQRDIHRLELGVASAKQGTERREAKVAIQVSFGAWCRK